MEARLTQINEQEVLRYLGHRTVPDARLRLQIESISNELMAVVRPRLVWRRLPLTGERAFAVVGKDLQALLHDCSEVALFAATLGAESELLLRRAQSRDMAAAVIMDACAGSAIENVCDNFCADLAEAVLPSCLTERFSPGYGDYPLSQQQVIFDLLNVTRSIGVTLTPSGLMLPQKSVTAIIGLSDRPQARRTNPCEGCALSESCTQRRENHACKKL